MIFIYSSPCIWRWAQLGLAPNCRVGLGCSCVLLVSMDLQDQWASGACCSQDKGKTFQVYFKLVLVLLQPKSFCPKKVPCSEKNIPPPVGRTVKGKECELSVGKNQVNLPLLYTIYRHSFEKWCYPGMQACFKQHIISLQWLLK